MYFVMKKLHKVDFLILSLGHGLAAAGTAAQICGYKRYWKRRDPDARKGGGIAVYVKNELRAAEWSRTRVNEDCGKEVMWEQVQGDRESVGNRSHVCWAGAVSGR